MSYHGFALFCAAYLLATATPGPGIGAIVARDGGWVLLDDKGTVLLAVTKDANGAPLFSRNKIFD